MQHVEDAKYMEDVAQRVEEDLLHVEELMHDLEEVEVLGFEEVVDGILQSMAIHVDRKKRKKVASL